MKRKFFAAIVFLALGRLAASCEGGRIEGLAKTKPGTGPAVVFDLFAKPLPEIPFPNDLATIPDSSTPTGRRVNASMIAPTWLETDVRRKLDRLDGFGTYAPLAVSFTAPIDLKDLRDRHADLSFENDTIFLINLKKGSRGYGKPVRLDFGGGNFQFGLERPDNYFENDARAGGSNLLFETYREKKDTDFDGVLDEPNTFDPDGDPYTDLVTFYEKETDTLLIRVVVPLEEQAEHAVVLTSRLRGEDGNSVRSPFEYVNHSAQTDRIEPLRDILPGLGLDIDEVTFAWTFTTQSVTRDLVEIRKGLYGTGNFAWLGERFPAKLKTIARMKKTGEDQYIFSAADMKSAIEETGEILGGGMDAKMRALLDTYDWIDYIFMATFETPYFLADRNGDGRDDDEVFEVDSTTGSAIVGSNEVTFSCAVPKPRGKFSKEPFPVSFYSHGYTSSRLEMLGFAGSHGRFGIATCGMDAVGHGLDFSQEDIDQLRIMMKTIGFEYFFESMMLGRSRDLNNDGLKDSGGDFWTADTFHTRDVVRQTIVDYMQLVRILDSFDGETKWDFDLGENCGRKIAGDFDCDGTADVGGGGNPYFVWGISLGGILSSILPAVEPKVRAAAPVAGGGGLADIGIRSTQGGVVEAVWLKIMGPIIVNRPRDGGGWVFSFVVPDVNGRGVVDFAEADAVVRNTRVTVTNLKTGASRFAVADENGLFRLQIAADRGDPISLLMEIPNAEDPSADPLRREISTFEREARFQGMIYMKGFQLRSPASGYGHYRQTPDIRRFMGIAQMILEPGDPINYAPHYFLDPLDLGGGPAPTNVMVVDTVGDMNVPINTGISTARAAGIIDFENIDSRYEKTPNQLLVDWYVYEGLEKLGRFGGQEILADVDDYDEGLDGFGAPALDPPLRLKVESRPAAGGESAGLSCVRFPYFNPHGQHGFDTPEPEAPFDMNLYMTNEIGWYFYTEGKEVIEDLCLEDGSCEFFP